ncbi:hypothetical protein Cgig2_009635 [Carnegiea gigantea]|uniref:Uncharacterized protein n=1 Tax=Carnegiea gigantea TaxID=171969 RepID=A0A9Q1JTH4_9CARY|nr:hypothetical protein Cgig2_009635 [Carnegiea gigantea]
MVGFYSTRTDASKGNTRQAGDGGIIRDHRGAMLTTFMKNYGYCSSPKAELLALPVGTSNYVAQALDLGYSGLSIEDFRVSHGVEKTPWLPREIDFTGFTPSHSYPFLDPSSTNSPSKSNPQPTTYLPTIPSPHIEPTATGLIHFELPNPPDSSLLESTAQDYGAIPESDGSVRRRELTSSFGTMICKTSIVGMILLKKWQTPRLHKKPRSNSSHKAL